jgi:hypothetical protein
MAAKKNGAKGNGTYEPEAPEGYSEVKTNIQGFWKPETPGDWVEGIVGERIEGKGADGKANVYYSLRLADDSVHGPFMRTDEGGKSTKVEAEAGLLVGVSGATLRAFMAGQIGKPVYLIYKGMGKAKPGQSAPRLFATFARDE